jgi:hypothetical protein
MWVDRFLKLAEWGFNVPLFLRNPSTNYGHGAHQQLRELFYRANSLTIIGARKDGSKEQVIRAKPLGTIFVETVHLEHKWEILVIEVIDTEFDGFVAFNEDGTGDYNIPLKGIFQKKFSSVEAIEDVKIRCLVRKLSRVCDKAGKRVTVYFAWTKKFCGVQNSRLIFLDYMV